MIRFKRGITREVVLIGRWAFKLPSLRRWKNFLQGLIANMQEAELSTWRDSNILCPVIFHIPGGLLTVMSRVEERTEELTNGELAYFQSLMPSLESKPNNYGYLNGRLVCIDYGN